MNTNEQKYWNKFYLENKHVTECTHFCKFVLDYFRNVKNVKYVLDSGCGNGRDSYTLAYKYTVRGIDSSGYIPITPPYVLEEDTNEPKLTFSCNDFVTFDKTKYDLVYSRFSFHSITNSQQEIFLDSIRPGSYVAIETRSNKSEKDNVAHGKTHFRNYTDIDYIKKLMVDKHLNILYIAEDKGFAMYKYEDPICIRVIAQKIID